MDLQLQTALIAAAVGLTTAVLATMGTWRLEKRRWITGLKTTMQTELYKVRLVHYPTVFAIFGRLSTRYDPSMDDQLAKGVARELSDWLYSPGGLVTESLTRAAVFLVRESLRDWHKKGIQPEDFFLRRNRALELLRRDIDIIGLEEWDQSGEVEPLLREIQHTLEQSRKRRRQS